MMTICQQKGRTRHVKQMTNGSAEPRPCRPRLTASPVKVTTRSRIGSPSITAAFNGIRRTDVLHQHANIRVSARRGEPVFPSALGELCLCAAEGYLVVITRNEISWASASTARSMEIACVCYLQCRLIPHAVAEYAPDANTFHNLRGANLHQNDRPP